MSRAKTGKGREMKVTCEAIVGRQGGKGIFGIEDAAEEVARQAKLAAMAERIAAYDRGYEGGRRQCPRCGQWQKYKGDAARELVFDCGALAVRHAYYVCGGCGQSSYPLDERLGLVEGKEQGRLREAEHSATSSHHQQLPIREHDRLYLEVDGHLCPTREAKPGPEDQGYREAKAVLAFSGHAVAEVSKERHEILHKILQAQITDSEAFRTIFTEVYQHAGGARAAEVSVLADGARWIWGMVEGVLPQAIQILDFPHAKEYLWEAGELIYGEGSALVAWVKKQETLRLEDKVEEVSAQLEHFVDLAPALATSIHYFHQNTPRMRYGTYRQRGYFIGSGATESAGKQLAAGRIKGPGMRWNVAEVNALLTLRCMCLEQAWHTYWETQGPLAA